MTLKTEIVEAVRELRDLELASQKELTEAGAKKVLEAVNQEKQAAEKRLAPVELLASLGAMHTEKIDPQGSKEDPAQTEARAGPHFGNAMKVFLGLLSDRTPDVESDADGRFSLSTGSNVGWVVAYRQKSSAQNGGLGRSNIGQHYWLVELPQKRSQLLLSSNNNGASAAEGVLRKIAAGTPHEGFLGSLLGAFKRQEKVAAVELDRGSVAGTALKLYTAEKSQQDRVNAERARIAAAQRAQREKVIADEREEKERIAAAGLARKMESERVAAEERAKQEAAARESERVALAEVRKRYAKDVGEGKVFLDEAGRLFRLVPGGSFRMGSGEERNAPVHTVIVAAFLTGEAEVTYGEWKSILVWAKANGYEFNNEGKGISDRHPVTSVSWFDVLKWANAKSEKEGLKPCYSVGEVFYRKGVSHEVKCDLNATGYRLPTEAEWEKAARGGVEGRPYPNGAGLAQDDANMDNSAGGTKEVKQYDPNEFGLYDLAGNVWEWCWDWWGPYSPVVSDPLGPEDGESRVLRGGGWRSTAPYCRVSYRGGSDPELHFDNGGFRIVLRTSD
jgi:formylglycine-generating enzyme required for sulfatase activity